MPDRHPLSWPEGKKRTKPNDRRNGTFVSNGKKVTLVAAIARLEDQVARLGGHYPLLSTNVPVRMTGALDGTFRPMDPGVCLYFEMKHRLFAMPCDTFTEVAQNIAAIANHIEATRRIESYGVSTAEEALQAFLALPGPSTPANAPTGAGDRAGRPWHEVLQVSATCSAEVVQASYRALAKTYANDEARLVELNMARDLALQLLAS